jgi:3-methyladenine DNA glycosylase AlkD
VATVAAVPAPVVPVPDPAAVADALDRRIRALPYPDPPVDEVRRLRRAASQELRRAPGPDVVAVAVALRDRQRWVAYELVYHHPAAREGVGEAEVVALGRGIDGWVAVDTFGRYVSGPAWGRRQVSDDLVQGWTRSDDRWWRRAALVSAVMLNLRAAGGTGDTARTLDICARLVADRDDMVVKALSWALRSLVEWDPDAVRGFLAAHAGDVAARARRETLHKLDTGRKSGKPRR